MKSLQFGAQVYSYASSNENTRCESSSGWRIGKTRENTGMAADESQQQKWGDRWSKEWGQNSSFCIIDGSLWSQEFGAGTTISEIQWSSRTPRWHCERWFRMVCSVYWARIISITNDGCNSNGHYIRTTRISQDKQQTQYQLTPKSKLKMHWRNWKFRSQDVQILGYVYPNANGLNHGPVWKSRSFLSKGICTVTFWQDYYGKGNLRKSYWSTVGKKFPNWECLFVNREKGLSCLCMWTI